MEITGRELLGWIVRWASWNYWSAKFEKGVWRYAALRPYVTFEILKIQGEGNNLSLPLVLFEVVVQPTPKKSIIQDNSYLKSIQLVCRETTLGMLGVRREKNIQKRNIQADTKLTVKFHYNPLKGLRADGSLQKLPEYERKYAINNKRRVRPERYPDLNKPLIAYQCPNNTTPISKTVTELWEMAKAKGWTEAVDNIGGIAIGRFDVPILRQGQKPTSSSIYITAIGDSDWQDLLYSQSSQLKQMKIDLSAGNALYTLFNGKSVRIELIRMRMNSLTVNPVYELKVAFQTVENKNGIATLFHVQTFTTIAAGTTVAFTCPAEGELASRPKVPSFTQKVKQKVSNAFSNTSPSADFATDQIKTGLNLVY
jgi:hypothetical protein